MDGIVILISVLAVYFSGLIFLVLFLPKPFDFGSKEDE